MELAPVARVERTLTAALCAAVAAVCILEARSPLAAAIRSGRTWTCRVDVAGGPKALAVYQTARRTAEIVDLGRASLEEEPSETISLPSAPERYEEGPVAARAALMPRTLRSWLSALDGQSLDGAFLLLELARANPYDVRPAYLPDDAAEREAFLSQLLGGQPPPPASGGPITVEVLNASGQKGIASDVTKILRSKGADVVHYGNVAAARAKTVVYDRTGRFENAEWVRGRLGCQAEAVTMVNAKSLVDVTVVLADDCKL